MRGKGVLTAGVLAWCLLGAGRAAAGGDQVIFLVRHAERADATGGQPPPGMMANNPPLSAAGHDRAKKLAALLASAEIKHIFTTEYVRTQQTAAPVAAATHITPVPSPARDMESLIQRARTAPGNVLIIGHTNTVPELLKRLGVDASIAIAESEYDNLFIVVRPASGEPTLIRLRY